MTDMMGKTALITGASRGIGAATARAFADAGANVVLIARSGDQIDAIASEIGNKARAVTCDVADYGQVEAAVAVALDAFGSVDFLVNNAGIIDPISTLIESAPDDWNRVIDINVKGVYHGMRAAIPAMGESGGVVVNISSGAATNSLEGWSHYCASKAAVLSLTRTVEKETPAHIRVVGLSPGTVATDMQHEIKASGINPVAALDWSEHIPPEWPAKAIVWLCGEDGAEFRGEDVSLRQESIRRRVGLIGNAD